MFVLEQSDEEGEVARPREFDEADAVRIAAETFWRRGYQATSIKELEEATGLTAGSLYKAYGSKRELFTLCLEQYMKDHSYLAILMRTFDKPLKQSLRSSSIRSSRPRAPKARAPPGASSPTWLPNC